MRAAREENLPKGRGTADARKYTGFVRQEGETKGQDGTDYLRRGVSP
jgi:hypothetical protein